MWQRNIQSLLTEAKRFLSVMNHLRKLNTQTREQPFATLASVRQNVRPGKLS